MNKQEARAIYRERRKELTERDVLKLQDLLLIRFQQVEMPPLHLVHAYVPLEESREPDPEPLLRWLKFRHPGLQVAAPRVVPGSRDMEHFQVDEETTWTVNRWGIPEPFNGAAVDIDQINMVLVPLLAFDRNGQRVGYGKGYYDRFLSACNAGTIKLGLSFFEAEESIEDTDTFDVRLDYVVTPERIYAFE
jgi:5-formyltetrahydrofolate cyclo-ligase